MPYGSSDGYHDLKDTLVEKEKEIKKLKDEASLARKVQDLEQELVVLKEVLLGPSAREDYRKSVPNSYTDLPPSCRTCKFVSFSSVTLFLRKGPQDDHWYCNKLEPAPRAVYSDTKDTNVQIREHMQFKALEQKWRTRCEVNESGACDLYERSY